MANKQIDVKSELREVIEETRTRIKAKMYGHGMLKTVSDKTGISKYKIRNAVTGKTQDIETLESVEKALTKILNAA